MKCEKCGAELTENSSFCHVCGKKVLVRKSKKNNGYNGFKIYNIVMCSAYGIALLTCFICNLAIDHSLTWFNIVLASVILSFCITNLPFILRKYRVAVSGVAATAMVFVLLYVCCAFTGGDWLYSLAFPVAAYGLVFLWLILITAVYLRANAAYKTSIILFLSGIITITCNPYMNYMLGDKDSFKTAYLHVRDIDYFVNNIVGAGLVFGALICLVIGICLSINKKRRMQ